MPTSSLASFSRRKPCTSRFAVLCRWPTITPGFSCGIFRWRGKWLNVDQDLPSSAVQASEECNHEFSPNVHKLLRILCTLPITSAERERLFSTLWRLKTYLRVTMTSERVSGLALMNIHHGRQIDIDATIDIFARKHPRRLLLSDILAEGTVNHKSTAFDD